MKIICIGRNYGEHAKELNNLIPDEPVIFLKPDTALIKQGQAFFIPDFSKEVHHEIEVLVRIQKAGKNIEPQFAYKYYDLIGLGVDFTARDKQNELKAKGLPWELAKAFDGSAFVSDWLPKEHVTDIQNIRFHLMVNEECRQQGNTADMLFKIDEIVSFVSRYFTLKTGDIIFTGTPAGVSAVKAGDLLEGFLEDQKLFSLAIR